MLLEFFLWWYGPGWKNAWKDCFTWVRKTQEMFSVNVLLKTLFSPWKRIVTLPGRSIDEKIHAMIDNLVSRVIGFVVRILVLVYALTLIIFSAAVGIIIAVSWPLLPFLGVGLIIWGLI